MADPVRTLMSPPLGGDEVREVRRAIGYMPDFFGVYDDMKVWEYLDFFAATYGVPSAGRSAMADDLLTLVDLDHPRRHAKALQRLLDHLGLVLQVFLVNQHSGFRPILVSDPAGRDNFYGI